MFHSLSQLKAAFAAGEISKPVFIEQAHAQFHAMLFKYALYIEDTDIASIQINDRRVVMTTRADGIAMIVDPSDHRTAPVESLNFNSYEPCESSIIRSLAPHIDTMLDIGANIGWYSLLVHSINKSSSIHAFEPIPNTFKRLSDNCSINQANTITCHNFGFSSEPGSFPFYFYPEGSGNASIRNLAGREDAQVIECELKTLGDFCLDLPLHPQLILLNVTLRAMNSLCSRVSLQSWRSISQFCWLNFFASGALHLDTIPMKF